MEGVIITVSNEIRQAKVYDLEYCILVSAGEEKVLDTQNVTFVYNS